MDQAPSSLRPPWWDANRGVNGNALRSTIGRTCSHFCNYNLALLVVEQMLQTGLLFRTTSSMGGFVEVPNDLVVNTVKVALETQYDNATIQQFRTEFNRMEDAQLASLNAGSHHHQRHASLMPYLVEMDLANEQGAVRRPALTSREVLPPPPNAVIFAIGYDHLATTTILRHVIDEVRTSYSRSNLARRVWGMVFGAAAAHRDQGIFFIERALEMGYDEAWRVHVTNATNGAAGVPEPAGDDDSSIDTIFFDESEKADAIDLDEDLERTFSSDDDECYEE